MISVVDSFTHIEVGESDCEGALPDSDDSIGLRAVLKKIDPYGSVGPGGEFNPSNFILQEKLNESETMLMDGASFMHYRDSLKV